MAAPRFPSRLLLESGAIAFEVDAVWRRHSRAFLAAAGITFDGYPSSSAPRTNTPVQGVYPCLLMRIAYRAAHAAVSVR